MEQLPSSKLWRVRIRKKWINLETTDASEALSKAEKLRQMPIFNGEDTIKSLLPEFIRYKLHKKGRGSYSVFSAREKEGVIRRFAEHLDDPVPSDIKPFDINAYQDYLIDEQNLAASTVNGYLMAVSSFFTYCVEQKKILKNPVSEVTVITEANRKPPEILSYAERNQVIENCPCETPKDKELKFVLLAGFHAGLRRNEIINARPEWFDLDRRTIRVQFLEPKKAAEIGLEPFRTKNKKDREIPLTDEFYQFLKSYPMKRDYCIGVGVRKGKSKYRYDFQKAYHTYMRSQNVGYISPHNMRHTFGGLLASTGEVDLGVIAKWIGDSLKVTADRYTHLIPAHDVLERAFSKQRTVVYNDQKSPSMRMSI